MDQDPTTGGTDTEIAQAEQNQNKPIIREVDSEYTKHDIKLPRENGSRKALWLVGGFIVLLALAVGGFMLWFFCFYNQPDKIIFDAMQNAFQAENINTVGTLTLTTRDKSEDKEIEKITLNIDSTAKRSSNATNVDLTISNSDGHSINTELGAIVTENGEVYLRIRQLMETLEGLGISEDMQLEAEELFNTLEVIDGEWWRIYLPEVVDAFNIQPAAMIKELFQCGVTAANHDNSGELIKFYQEHSFLSVQDARNTARLAELIEYKVENGYGLYEVEVNATELANFLNKLPEAEAAEEFYACYNDVMREYVPEADSSELINATDFDEVSASEFEWSEEIHIFMKVSTFGHELDQIYMYRDTSDTVMAATFKLGYRTATVTGPNSYRPISDLVEEIKNTLMEVVPIGSNNSTFYGWEEEA